MKVKTLKERKQITIDDAIKEKRRSKQLTADCRQLNMFDRYIHR